MKQIYHGDKIQEIIDNQPTRKKTTLKELLIDAAIIIALDTAIVAGLLYGINEQQKINEIKNQYYKQTYPEAYKLMNK